MPGFAADDGARRGAQVNSIVCEGRRQRFCQQCGRFHDLASFDGDKRSCRARLQRHNARRRKKADVTESSRVGGPSVRLRGGHSLAKKGAREDETVDYARASSVRQKQSHGSSCLKARRTPYHSCQKKNSGNCARRALCKTGHSVSTAHALSKRRALRCSDPRRVES